MALTLASPIVVVDDVTHREIGDEAVLLHLQDGTYFSVNDVGRRAWGLLVGGASLREAYDCLLAEYEVEPAVLEADLLAWADTLLTHRLIRHA